MMRRRVAAGIGALLVTGAVAACAPAPEQDTPPRTRTDGAGTSAPPGDTGSGPAGPYVALGDSYTSAPGTGDPVGAPPGCQRSDNNYPRLVAERLDVAHLTDVSCGGATTEHAVVEQRTPRGTNPAQLDAVSHATSLVTLGFGGNDVGLVDLAVRCAGAASARARCAPGEGGDTVELGSRVDDAAESVGDLVEAVRERAPQARVVVVGYPSILPDDAEACGHLPYSTAEIDLLRGGLDALDDALREVAQRQDVVFADTRADTRGHGVCAPESRRWIAPPGAAADGAA
ncbi:SGNH/GDSL hydrolase family protein, partial [Saccharomonospora iraqiensis]|uniref:SGNH/GDSL hydrolase family protein n=1 Tax=Saccharomonospora iraqiensis TaxID=52698 RepID=UPI000696CD3E